jgi:type IV pilus assembly protein PilO
MKLDDFKNIDFKNIANLPLPVKAVFLAVLMGLLVLAGYWFLWKPSLTELDTAKASEVQLREVFLSKKKEAINLDLYKQQMLDIERILGALLKQLPGKAEMAGLLTDINQAGLQRGLEFELFKPGAETVADFYAEMPISIKVTGSYNDLGGFAGDISKLSRIVTLNNLSITSSSKDGKDGRLVMEAVAKTYRYLDAEEAANKKKAEAKSAKKGMKK